MYYFIETNWKKRKRSLLVKKKGMELFLLINLQIERRFST